MSRILSIFRTNKPVARVEAEMLTLMRQKKKKNVNKDSPKKVMLLPSTLQLRIHDDISNSNDIVISINSPRAATIGLNGGFNITV